MRLYQYNWFIFLAGVLLLNCSCAQAGENMIEWLVNFRHTNGVKPVTNKTYKEECGSCHFAYQPGLLPSRSWEKLLTEQALHNHFGEIADLDKDTLSVLYAYAMDNAADKSYYKKSRKIAVATEGIEAPLRITEVKYIKRKHHNIPDKKIKDNKGVKSLSYCNVCHKLAEEGNYDADTVNIPNYPD
jgi:hypothetical protein